MIFQQFLHSTLHTTCRAETMLLHKARRGNLTSHFLLSNSIQKFLLRKSETGKYLAKLMVIIQYQSMDDALYHLTINLSLWRCLVESLMHHLLHIIGIATKSLIHQLYSLLLNLLIKLTKQTDSKLLVFKWPPYFSPDNSLSAGTHQWQRYIFYRPTRLAAITTIFSPLVILLMILSASFSLSQKYSGLI